MASTSSPLSADPDEFARPSESRLDPTALTAALQDWLAGRLGARAAPVVTDLSAPSESGMSSDTVMFDARWSSDAGPVVRNLVARLAPTPGAVPVFPDYDLGLQAEVMRTVAAHTSVPIPEVLWYEPSPEPLGAEFLVMERVDGLIPPDVMPYNFESWLLDASQSQRRRLQESTIGLVADVHGIPEPWSVCPGLADGEGPVSAARALQGHMSGVRGFYNWVAAAGRRSPLIERALDELEASVPPVDGPAVLCWGDARIGNVIYRDFRPAAVLDWEMAALGPRGMDLGWMIFLHRFFEDIAAAAGLPGMPGLLRREDVVAEYARRTGRRPADIEWFVMYAAVRQAVIMFRIQCRAVAFGQADPPGDPDEMIMHRASLEKMLAGAYWPALDAEEA